MQPLEDDLNIEMGYCYDSGRAHENPRDSKGRPGTRAPHVWLERNGEEISTLDLLGQNFALLAGPEGTVWRESANDGVDLVEIGEGGIADPENALPGAYGIYRRELSSCARTASSARAEKARRVRARSLSPMRTGIGMTATR
jgi:hypothetical protein